MRRLPLLLLWFSLSLALGSCSKSNTGTDNVGGSAAPTQLNWDQGNWNQTNWQ